MARGPTLLHLYGYVECMCALRVLWRFESDNAADALRAKSEYLDALHNHAGVGLDKYAANLVYTELVSNVFKHARGGIRIKVERNGEDLLLTVADQGPGFNLVLMRAVHPLSEGGRGLFLAAHYAHELRVVAEATGTTVTAALRQEADGD
jgi:anti-sigma regulatory factor (Ser/Thr protein kinase)